MTLKIIPFPQTSSNLARMEKRRMFRVDLVESTPSAEGNTRTRNTPEGQKQLLEDSLSILERLYKPSNPKSLIHLDTSNIWRHVSSPPRLKQASDS